MVNVYIGGGLGNQLFMYAAARAICVRNGTEMRMILHQLADDVVYKRKYALGAFNCIGKSFCLPNRLLRVLFNRFLSNLLYKLPGQDYFFWDKEKIFTVLPDQIKHPIIMRGIWQSEKYFSDIKDVIYKDFTLRDDSWLKLDRTFALISETSDSTFIHVRSYKDIPSKSDGSAALPVSYYVNAIHKAKELIPQIKKMFVFSDDLQWAINRIGKAAAEIGIELVPVNRDQEIHMKMVELYGDYDVDGLRDFMLMRACAHGILANSSFSWWAGYLGELDALNRGVNPIRIHVEGHGFNEHYWPERWMSVKE